MWCPVKRYLSDLHCLETGIDRSRFPTITILGCTSATYHQSLGEEWHEVVSYYFPKDRALFARWYKYIR